MFLEQIIVLSLIQGITEFLPISSSGHLILAPALMGWQDQGVFTDAVLNLGSVAAVVIYFWRDVLAMLHGVMDVLRRRSTFNSHLLINIIIGTLPIIVVGLLVKLSGLDEYMRSPTLVAINAIVFGILLYVADTYGVLRNSVLDLNWKSALIIGGAQALAISPGTSRSGITMTASRGLGLTRPESARFSFLLSIPANAAASVLAIGSGLHKGEAFSGSMIMAGILTFFIALGAIAFLMRLLRSVSFVPFVFYRLALGLFLLGLIYWGVPLGGVN
jgi:undecaprenyl-diphosphatase